MAEDGLVLEAKIRAKFDEASFRQESQKAGGLMARILESNFSKGLTAGLLRKDTDTRTAAGGLGQFLGKSAPLVLAAWGTWKAATKMVDLLTASSGRLAAMTSVLDKSFKLALKPMADAIGTWLRPMALGMLWLARQWNKVSRAAGPNAGLIGGLGAIIGAVALAPLLGGGAIATIVAAVLGFIAATGGAAIGNLIMKWLSQLQITPPGPSTGSATIPGYDYNPENPNNVLDSYKILSSFQVEASKRAIVDSYTPSKFASVWDFLADFIKVIFRGTVGRVAEAIIPSAGAAEITAPGSSYAGLSGLDLINAPGSERLSWKTGAASVASKSQVDQILAHYNTVFGALVANVMGSTATTLASGATTGGISPEDALKMWQTTGNMPAGTSWDDPWVKANFGYFTSGSGYGLSDPAQLAAEAVNLQRPGFFSFLQSILPVASRVGSTVSPLLASIVQGAQSFGGNLGNVPLDLNFPGGQAGDLMNMWGGYRNTTGGTAFQTVPFEGINIGAGGTVTVKVYLGNRELTDIVRTEIETGNYLASTAVS